MVRRCACRARLGARGRAPAQGAVPQVRSKDDQGLHRRLVRLLGAACHRIDPQAAEGKDRQYRAVGSARRHPARRAHAQGHRRHRSQAGDDRGRSARQSALRRLRPQYLARRGDKRGRRRDLQQPRQGYSAQRRIVSQARLQICREQRGGVAGVSAQLLDGDHERRRAPCEHHPVGFRQVGRWPRPCRRRHRPRRRHGRAFRQYHRRNDAPTSTA
jgi:hypothetical protein